MRNTWKHLVVGSLLLFGATACADLNVVNQNDPDAARTIVTPSDILALVTGGFNNWFYGNYNYYGPGMAIANAAFQFNAPWANSGMEKYGRLPRIAFINSVADADYNYMTRSWFYSYRALSAVADGLRGLEDPEVSSAIPADELAAGKAFAKFIQGIAHAEVAVLFSEGFQVDETINTLEPQEPLSYTDLMDAAMGYFDQCISMSSGASWVLPIAWMEAELTGPELAQVAHSMKARYAAAVARSPAERQALNWDAIMADVNAGITSDFMMYMDQDNGWYNDVLDIGTDFGWSQMAYFVYGMADQSGNFQLWDSYGLKQKNYNLDGTDILIVTPDLRFPQGTTIDEQRAHQGLYFRINKAGSETGSTWARSDRGVWRWSWYKHTRGQDYYEDQVMLQPEIRMEEMNLLTAEGLYWKGDKAGAAAIINETRVPAGLNATDATGTNTSCVPKLPGPGQGSDTAPGDSNCGGLFEMLKWEKRMENTFKGPYGNLWYFDGRGWGDLWKDTFLHLPIPCLDAQVLELTPCGSFGGPGGEGGSPGSVYQWNGEGG